MKSSELESFRKKALATIGEAISDAEDRLQEEILLLWKGKRIKFFHRWSSSLERVLIEGEVGAISVTYCEGDRIEIRFFTEARNPLSGRVEGISVQYPILE